MIDELKKRKKEIREQIVAIKKSAPELHVPDDWYVAREVDLQDRSTRWGEAKIKADCVPAYNQLFFEYRQKKSAWEKENLPRIEKLEDEEREIVEKIESEYKKRDGEKSGIHWKNVADELREMGVPERTIQGKTTKELEDILEEIL